MVYAYPRHVRIASSVQQIIAPTLVGVLPNSLITIIQVEVSKDLGTAKILYSVIGAEIAAVEQLLEELKPSLRHKLSKEMTTKRIPELKFVAAIDGWSDYSCTVS